MIYLVRHGIAEEGDGKPDAERILTAEGVKKFRKTAHGLARALDECELRGLVIYTSPLLRARQTAEILLEAVEGASGKAEIRVSANLAPPGDLATFVREARGARGAGAIVGVGHEPVTSEWIGRLCFGAAGRVRVKKGAVAGIELAQRGLEGELVLLWQPGVLRALAK